MKRVVAGVVVVAVAALLGWQICVRIREQAAAAESSRPGGAAVPVEVTPVRTATVRDVAEFTGTLLPRAQFVVAPKVSGRLEKLLVDIGDRVKNGDLVAELDSEEYAQQVAQAQIKQRDAALKTAQVRLSYTRIQASWEDGEGPRLIAERFADQGAMLRANDPIVSVVDVSTVIAVINVIERDFPDVLIGQPAVLTTDAYGDREFAGRIARRAPVLKEESRQARVEVEIPNPDGLLAPGMFVRARIQFAQHDGATVVPTAALARRGSGQGVSLARLPVDLMPDITYPTLSVYTTYENASPAEIEELVTRPIEEAMSAVPGVQEVSSNSSEGRSNVRISFVWGTNLDEAANDIRDRLDRVIARLPDDADRPSLRKFDIASFPILILGASSNLDPVQMRRIIDDEVKYRIERVPGVAALDVWGGLAREIHVDLDPDKLKALEIPLDTVLGRIRVGSLAETELAAAEAEVALRREALINAHGDVDTLRVRLLRLLRPSALAGSVRQLTPETVPAAPPADTDTLQSHVGVALKMRPDLNQARLQLQIGDLELVKTRNGLLPRMDLFISLGKTGYARSFGGSVGGMPGDAYDTSAGLTFELPVGNRLARARQQRAVLTRSQLEEGLRNVEDLVREDVEAAYIETGRALQQVTATAATRRLQEEKLRAETAKFRVGKSTALLVAATQSDLVTSQVAEVEAVTTYLKALTDLYLLEGSLLARRGIEAPGERAVEGD